MYFIGKFSQFDIKMSFVLCISVTTNTSVADVRAPIRSCFIARTAATKLEWSSISFPSDNNIISTTEWDIRIAVTECRLWTP